MILIAVPGAVGIVPGAALEQQLLSVDSFATGVKLFDRIMAAVKAHNPRIRLRPFTGGAADACRGKV